jgi:phage gp29-like protein
MAYTIYPSQQRILELLENSTLKEDKSRSTAELFKLLRKISDFNPRISGHILTRNTAISAFSWRIIAADSSDEQKAQEATTRLKETITALSSRHALTHVYGHQVYTLSWSNDTGEFVPDLQEENYEDYECFEGKFFRYNGSKKYLIEPSNELLLDASKSSNTQGGIMRSVLLSEILRIDTLREQANFIKKMKGILQVINKGGDGEERIAAEQAAATAIKENYLITSEMIEFKLNQITSGQSSPFSQAIADFNKDIAIAFLGQANTTELPNSGGSRAALNVLSMISADIHYSDIMHFENFINSQLLKIDHLLNYGEYEVPYEFKISIDEEIDREANGVAITALLDTGLPFLKSEIYQLAGMTIPPPDATEDDIVKIDKAF